MVFVYAMTHIKLNNNLGMYKMIKSEIKKHEQKIDNKPSKSITSKSFPCISTKTKSFQLLENQIDKHIDVFVRLKDR